MGFFSKTRAKTHLPVLASGPWSRKAKRLTRIVVLQPGREPWTVDYDGYGLGLETYHEAKFVLASDYAGERYEQLGPGHDEPQQGYFLDECLAAELAKLPRFANYDAYEDVLRDFETQYDIVVEEELTRLGLPFEANRAYKVALLLEDLFDGADQLRPVDLTQFPTLSGCSIEGLRAKAGQFVQARTERLTVVARQVLAPHFTAA